MRRDITLLRAVDYRFSGAFLKKTLLVEHE